MRSLVSLRQFLCLLVWSAVVSLSASGQAADPTAGRAGGLVPGGQGRRAGLTREELIREWDLDGDGTISKSEADVARGRMRKRRIEMQLQAGIDPLTGSPLQGDAGVDEPATEPGAEPEFRLPPELPPPPRSKDREDSLPGMRPPAPPRATAPASGLPATTLPGEPAGPRAEPAKQVRPSVSSRASWLPPQTLAPAMTGGVRAGAPAAVPGYGAGPWADLNAGRRRPAESGTGAGFGAGVGAGAGQPATGGGLLPASRPPGRTGALILPNVSGRTGLPAAPLPNARPAPPPLVPRPRITAEDMGGYRP
jgi:hypothetical protein